MCPMKRPMVLVRRPKFSVRQWRFKWRRGYLAGVAGLFDSNGKGSELMSQAVIVSREAMIDALNGDLAREYQSIIAYINYSQVLKGAEYMNIARELEAHAAEELAHALQISKQIDYLGGMPTVVPEPVRTSKKAREMLKFDLDNELTTIAHYRTRIREAEALGEYAMCEVLRDISMQEQDHAIDLATALGIDVPPIPDIEP
jgi:bacterioferritin